MDQDVILGIAGSITQADLAPIRGEGRLGEYAVIYRIERIHQGGGYGDQGRHPFAWAVAVYIDNQLFRVFNARGAGREWNSLDKLGDWLREQGFYYWWTRNDLEVLGTATSEAEIAENVIDFTSGPE
jgi:adenine-specific DNA methylase